MKTAIAIAGMIISLTAASAQQPSRNVATFGVHMIAPVAFQKIHFGVNAVDYLHVSDETLVGASLMLHYVPQRIHMHVGVGLMDIFEIADGRTYYYKGEIGFAVSTHVDDVGAEPTISGFDTISRYGASAKAATGMRSGFVDISLFALYQNLPGNKFWPGVNTSISF